MGVCKDMKNREIAAQSFGGGLHRWCREKGMASGANGERNLGGEPGGSF
jgi:hypothetical protein